MKWLARLLFWLLFATAAHAQTDSFLATNGTFKSPFSLANTWSGAQTFNGTVTFASVPSTPLTQFHFYIGNVSNVAVDTAAFGDCIFTALGFVCTKTNGVAFATLATKVSPVCADLTNSAASCAIDATNAANISSGTLNTARLPAAVVLGANGGTGGSVTLNGSTSGSAIIQVAAAAGTGTKFQLPATNGANTNVLQTDGTGITSWVAASGGALGAITVQRCGSGLTCDGASHTYTPTGGTVRIKVRMAGGGGGGGAVATNNGANGGDTSFASWTAIHGNGGGAAAGTAGAGGTGGVNGTGTLVRRTNGQSGIFGGSGIGGAGGSNPFVGGAPGVSFQNAAGLNATPNTGGGGGGGSNASAAGSSGGAGEYVEFWVQSSIGTPSYTSGNGGTGGAAGTQAGGNGAQGPIEIEEYPF